MSALQAQCLLAEESTRGRPRREAPEEGMIPQPALSPTEAVAAMLLGVAILCGLMRWARHGRLW